MPGELAVAANATGQAGGTSFVTLIAYLACNALLPSFSPAPWWQQACRHGSEFVTATTEQSVTYEDDYDIAVDLDPRPPLLEQWSAKAAAEPRDIISDKWSQMLQNVDVPTSLWCIFGLSFPSFLVSALSFIGKGSRKLCYRLGRLRRAKAALCYDLSFTKKPNTKSNSSTLAKRQQRAEVNLLEDGIRPVPATRYETSLRQFEAMPLAGIQLSLTDLCSAGASQAISVIGVWYLQMGSNSLLHAVGDGQVCITALKRALVIPGALLLVESVLAPVREALSKWRVLEPYEYRQPVTLETFEAGLVLATCSGDLLLTMHLLIGHTAG